MSTQPVSARRRSLLKSTLATTLSSAAAGSLAPLHALAQDYPSKTIRIISPFSPGATADLVARAVGPALASAWAVNS